MQRYKRVLAIFLAFSLLLGMTAFPVAAAVETVSDMPAETDWSYAALKAAMDNDLLRGSGGKVQPEALLTRSQLAAVVVRAFGAQATSDLGIYTDLAASAWYHDDMARAVAMGVLNGNDGKLRPEDSVTRQEAFTILARAMKLSGGPDSALASYSDRADVAPWAEDAMASLVSGGYIQGNGASLNPAAVITRAEFAQVMYKLIFSYIDKAGAYDKVAEGTVMVRADGVKLKDAAVTHDLILGDGIGSGETALDGVTVAGRTVIRGGSAVLVQGSSSLGAVVIDRPAGGMAFKLQDKAAVGSITICSNGVALSGIPKGTSVTVNQGVTGATLEGVALPEGTSYAPGAAVVSGGGGGGNPPATTVATTAMTVNPAAQTIAAGVYKLLTVTRNTGANDALTWSSSDETVAVVDAAGNVGAKKSGEAVIAVLSASGVVASATVYVQEPTEDEITISVPGTVLTGGSYKTITVAVSVGTGDYTLNGVAVGTLETHGGGIHSGHIDGGSVGTIDIQGTPEEGSRVLLSGGAVVGEVNVGESASQAALEVAQGDSASVGSVTAAAALTVTNTVVTTGITTASGMSLVNSITPVLNTTGAPPVPVALNGSAVGILNAGAAGGTTISAGSGGATLPAVNASGSVTTGANVGVGTIVASGSSGITANGPVGSITGAAGPVSLNNAGGTLVSASAGSVSVSGASTPVVSGPVTSGITVNANPAGSSGVTVLAGSPPIVTAGSGTVGQISVGDNAAPTITAGAPIGAVLVTGTAAPTVGGTAPVSAVVSSSSGTTTVGNTNTAAVLATDTATVSGATAQPAVVTLQSIAVTAYPAKLNYAVGSAVLDTTGMVVTGYYTVTGFDGTVSRVLTKDTDYTVGTVDMSGAGTKLVTVTTTVSGKTASFPVSVVAKAVGLVAVTTLPTKLVYEKGEALNVAGGELTVVYTNSNLYPNEGILLTNEMVFGYSTDTPGVQALTVTYSGKTAVFTITVKDSLGAARTTAQNELNAHAAVTLASAPYSAAGRAAIESARKSGETAIGGAANVTAVAAALSNAKTAISGIPNQAAEWEVAANAYRGTQSAILAKTPETVAITDKAAVSKALVVYAALEDGVRAKLTAEKAKLDALLAKIAALEAAQTLDAAIDTAMATLDAAYENYGSGYDTNRTAVDTAKTAGNAAIETAASVSAVTAALDKAMAAMAAVKSDAALLGEAKAAAITDLNTYASDKSKGDYDAAGKAAIEAARRTGEAAITAAGDSAAVGTALASAKAAINAVKTITQVAADKLAAAKTASKAELTAYGNPGLYSGTQKMAFDNAKAQGAANIDAAASVAAVTTALNAAKAAVTAVKTDAQVAAETLAMDKANAIAALNAYWGNEGALELSYSATGKALIASQRQAGINAINASTDSMGVNAALASAKEAIDGVNTAVEEDSAALSAAKALADAMTDIPAPAQAVCNTEEQAREYARAKVVAAIKDSSITVTINKTAFAAAVAGGEDNAAGTDGSYVFTVTVSKGVQSQTSEAKTLVITAAKVLSRADLAVALYDALNGKYGLNMGTTHPFTDVSGLPDKVRSAIGFCYNNGLAVGVSNTTFVPNGAVTRAEAAAVLARIVPVVTSFELERTVTPAYTDVAQNEWYYDSVMAMGGAGVFPAEELFRPNDFITPVELGGAMGELITKLDVLRGSIVSVTDGSGLADALGNSAVRYIKLTGSAALGENAVLGAGKTLTVGANAALTVAAGGMFQVDGILNTETESTVNNKGMILVSGGGVFNNAGTVEGCWVDDPNSDNPNDGWYESSVVTDVVIGQKISGTVNNTGTIRDTLQINDYLADTPAGDVKGGFTNKQGCLVTRFRPTAVVKTTAALKRALADGKYAQLDGLGAFALSEDVTVPEYVQLFFPKAWEEGGVRTETSLTIPDGITLTIEDGAELRINCGVAGNAGTILNDGYMELNNGTLNITGAAINNGYFKIQNNGRVTGGNKINNSGTVEATSVYAAEEDRTVVALDGCAGDGVLRSTAYVYDGAKLGLAAGNPGVNSIWIVAEGGTDTERTVTMSGDVTLRPDVSIFVTAYIDDDDPEAIRHPITLVVPGGASLTVNGEMGVSGMVEVQMGGTLTLNGNVTLREKRDQSYETFGTLKNAGSVTLGENAVLDCGGDIVTTGAFTNNGEIRVHANSGPDYPKYGAVTGTIIGNQPANVTVVTNEQELADALAASGATTIRTVGDIALTGDLVFTKPVTITEGTVTAGNHSLTVADNVTITITQNGTLNFYAEENGGLLAVNTGAALRAVYGGRLIIGDENTSTPSAEGSVVNHGSILSIRGEVRFVEAEEWEVLIGEPVIYYANRADLVRMLGQRLGVYMEQPEDEDFQHYGSVYGDWSDMYGEDWNDEEAIWGYAILLKNSLITGTGEGRLSPYGDLNYAAAKELFSRIADELLGANYNNAAMTDFLNGITQSDAVTYSHQKYIDNNQNEYWDNSLSVLTNNFVEALGMYRANVSSIEELSEALEKPFVTEIHITESIELPAGSSDESEETKLTGARDGERTVTVDADVILTIPQYARLTIEQGVILVLKGRLANSGGMDVFGGLGLDDWREHYDDAENAYINFYPDFLDFANRLHERVEAWGLEANPEEIVGKESDNWPNGDGREWDFAFLVKYGGVQRKTEDGHTWWPAYDKVTYGELKGVLTHVRQAICHNTEELPGSVSLSGKGEEHLVNDEELNTLLDLFMLTLPRVDDSETTDVTVSATAGEEPVHYVGKRFTQKVTVGCDDSEGQNGWGGEVIFENCEFAGGLEIMLGGVSYGVSLKNCAKVTEGGGVVVSPAEAGEADLSGEVRLGLREVPNGQIISASVPVDVSSRVAGGSFTLNGVAVTGAAELGGDMAYGAGLWLESYGEDLNFFQCAALGLYGEVRSVDATASADFAEKVICTYELSDCERAVSLNVGTVNMSTTGNPLRFRNHAEGSTLAVTGTVTGSVELSCGEIDVSGLALTDGRVLVGTWDDRGVTAIVGSLETELVGGGEHPVTIRASERAVIHMAGLPTEYINQLMVNPSGGNDKGIFEVDVPHIFEAEGSYQIFVGTTDQDMDFEVYQGDGKLNITAAYVDEAGQSGDGVTPVKTHLSFDGQPENTENMTLHMIKGDITLIVQLEPKTEP
ncbi:exported hypothetical protein [uncultured Eubacteriales bacterium]|uniref:SLH domain-containing protein n=1 Tax=uncultured Eubacteriales bacterium TaxID=172733 RepID=A0A212IY77_9FIRM|nr:exported hypothetical protein [uncultured Eubacteriales bacterium]